jgi:hypothetical protein
MLGFPGKPQGFTPESLQSTSPLDTRLMVDHGQLDFLFKSEI